MEEQEQEVEVDDKFEESPKKIETIQKDNKKKKRLPKRRNLVKKPVVEQIQEKEEVAPKSEKENDGSVVLSSIHENEYNISEQSHCDKCMRKIADNNSQYYKEGQEWIGCNAAGCGRWFHPECLSRLEKKGLFPAENYAKEWICYHCTRNKGWDPKQENCYTNLELVRKMARNSALDMRKKND